MRTRLFCVWLVLVLGCGTKSALSLVQAGSTQPAPNPTNPATGSASPTTPASFSLQGVDPKKGLDFGGHDIATRVSQNLDAISNSDQPMDLSLSILNDGTGEFSADNSCLSKLPPHGHCVITVQFAPITIGKDGDRTATLRVTADNKESQDVPLKATAFQNLGVAPSDLNFENQVGNATSIVRNVLVTNYTNAQINGITVTLNGDFTENHSTCVNIASGGSCSISVTYSAKLAGETKGSLTITPNQLTLGKLPRVVLLHGSGLTRCKTPDGPPWKDWSLWLVVSVSGLYFISLILVRWHMIAKPARAQVVAEIDQVRSRVLAEKANLPDSPQLQNRFASIQYLLDHAVFAFRHRHFPQELARPAAAGSPAVPLDKPVLALASTLTLIFFVLWLVALGYQAFGGWSYLFLALWVASLIALIVIIVDWNANPNYFPRSTRLFNAVFWTRGHEVASYSLIHEAELQLVAILPLERVRARLETAEQELREIQSPVAVALADRIHQSLTTEAPLIQDRSRELLQQLLPLLNLPQGALSLVFADIEDCLQNLLDWIQQNTALPADQAAGKARLQQFATTAKPCEDLAKQINPLLENLPDPPKVLFQQITSFFTNLIPSAQTKISDPQLDPNACKNFLDGISTDAAKLMAALKSAALPQDRTLQGFLDACKLQPAVIPAVIQATTPSPAIDLLKRIRDALQPQAQSIQQINETPAATEIAPYRASLIKLAAQPGLPQGLTEEINCILSTAPLSLLKRWKALLMEALSLIYDNTDLGFSQLATWHNKMIWLVGCALLAIFALAVTLRNPILLLVGGVGGLLSRLQRTMAATDVANDYGATWGALFLSPLTGALSAWGGILLIILGLRFNIFGTALNIDWCNPFDPATLALALLFGFMERLFDGIAGTIQDKLLKSPSGSPSPASTTAAPKIASVSPTGAVLGKEVQITVRGENFQSGATATVTDDSGKPQPAKVDFKDAKTVVVTFTPSGSKAFTAILTVTNPDKQTDMAKLGVTAGS